MAENVRDAGVIGEWHPNEIVKFEGMLGVSATGATVGTEGQTVPSAIVPISNVQATFTPAGDSFKLDLGFKRAIFDLSPQLVANRVVRNDFILRKVAFNDGSDRMFRNTIRASA